MKKLGILIFIGVFLGGCATMPWSLDEKRFKSSTICFQEPTMIYRDAKLDVCWIMIQKMPFQMACSKTLEIGYCDIPMKKTQPEAKAVPKKVPEKAKDAKKTKKKGK